MKSRQHKLVEILHAKGCAWRATYINVCDAQVFRAVLDPTASRGPTLSFGFGIGNFANRLPRGLQWTRPLVWRLHGSASIPLPHVRWKYKGSRLRNWLAGRSSRFWNSLDGRFVTDSGR